MSRYLAALVLLSAAVLTQHARALQDPTRPTDPAAYFDGAASNNSWALQSILSSPAHHIAIINGIHVREGDYAGSAKVVSISESKVVLDSGGRTLTLRLQTRSVKARP